MLETETRTSASSERARLIEALIEVAAERGYIDDVIMPHATRGRIARALAMLREKRLEMPARKHDNLPL